MGSNISPIAQYLTPPADAGAAQRSPLSAFVRVPADDPGIDWDAGWGLRSECPAGGIWCCGDGLTGGDNIDANALKADPAGSSPLQFKPFLAYQVAGCTRGASRIPGELQAATTASAEWLDANIDGWLTLALEIGVCGNPGLADLPDISGAEAMDLDATIATLIRNRRDAGMFDRPTLHIPDWYAPSIDSPWLPHVANVVLGPGYSTHPDVAPPAGEAWVYITGTVEYSYGGRSVASLSDDDLDIRRQNRSWQLSEQLAVYRFDPCAGFRARAKVC